MSLAKSGVKIILDFLWALNPKIGILYKMRGHRDTEGYVKMVAETGVMYLPPKIHQGLLAAPEAGREAWTISPLDTPEESSAADTLILEF